jgi:hypothetical protein
VTSFQLAERPFGDDDGVAPNRIRRGGCNRLFRVLANLNQSTTNPAKRVKNGKNRLTGETHCFSIVGLFRAYRCGSFCFHVCLVEVKPQCADRKNLDEDDYLSHGGPPLQAVSSLIVGEALRSSTRARPPIRDRSNQEESLVSRRPLYSDGHGNQR